MRFSNLQTAAGAVVLFLSLQSEAKHGHGHQHFAGLGKKHQHTALHASPHAGGDEQPELKKRGTCAFPTDAGLVAVTPNAQNAGWAMSPDQPCKPNSYCPTACPSGQLSMQWDPTATSYTYPMSMHGGAFCNANGEIEKPFPNRPWCVDGVGSVVAVNDCGEVVSFCQTVLPGNEAMLIPTAVESTAVLAVPGPEYWCGTAAHYYINPPGVGPVDACVWSDGSKPIGNWSPYVAGANADASGNTYVKIGWNPICTNSNQCNTAPTFGIKIECPNGGCNGLPCSIDPSTNSIGGVTSPDSASGAGGANFCVVTVPSGGTANIVVFNAGDSNASSGPGKLGSKVAVVGSTSTTTTSTTTTTTTTTSTTTTTTTTTSSTTSATSTTTSSTTSSVTSSGASSSSFTSITPSSSFISSSYPSISPHIFFENITSTASGGSSSTGSSPVSVTASAALLGSASPSPSKKGAAARTLLSSGLASLGLLMAVAAGYIL